jgi:hypothetical protein
MMELLIMKFSSLPCYLFPLMPKYSPQHPSLKHPQPTLATRCKIVSVEADYHISMTMCVICLALFKTKLQYTEVTVKFTSYLNVHDTFIENTLVIFLHLNLTEISSSVHNIHITLNVRAIFNENMGT